MLEFPLRGADVGVSLRPDADLNRGVKDESYILTPSLGGDVTYRPNDWLEATLEATLEREWRRGPEVVVLPDGELQLDEKKPTSLLIDQAFVKFKGFTDPFEVTLGRRKFADDRNWVFDKNLDGALLFDNFSFIVMVNSILEV